MLTVHQSQKSNRRHSRRIFKGAGVVASRVPLDGELAGGRQPSAAQFAEQRRFACGGRAQREAHENVEVNPHGSTKGDPLSYEDVARDQDAPFLAAFINVWNGAPPGLVCPLKLQDGELYFRTLSDESTSPKQPFAVQGSCFSSSTPPCFRDCSSTRRS